MKNKSFRSGAAAVLLAAMLCALIPYGAAASSAAWDGTAIDVSWYSPGEAQYTISTPEQLMGLAAIVNGIYNDDIATIIGDEAAIVDIFNDKGVENGSNNKSTSTYHYGADDFGGKTVYLAADLDMGGKYDIATGQWSGPNYMPIGGQYLMRENDGDTKLSSSFCGVLDGQGHTVFNIYCSRRCTDGNFGDGQSVGLIGRLGVHDNDPADIRPKNPAVRNLAITGYIYANRSVGGIVGKIGKTSYNSGDGSTGAVIENCANFAAVSNTDAKGCGGIAGAGWNGGVIQNCYNAGNISTTYVCPTGGISGSNEITIRNCYSVGEISAPRESYAMGIGTNNGGGTDVDNCFWLAGSAPGGGYYGRVDGTVTELTSSALKSPETLAQLGAAFIADGNDINGGYPVLAWQADDDAYGDVSPDAWYASDISYSARLGLFDAPAPRVFSPESPMTRGMLAAALYRLSGSLSAASSKRFTDVPESSPYFEAVSWAAGAGIVTGLDDSTFAPDASITREQIAVMFHRAAAAFGADTSATGDISVFADASAIGAWAKDGFIWAVGAGLISGVTPDTAQPQGTATRAQAAALLRRFAG